jgi:glycosyltransferase involved in cell wall biosynthesis
MSVTVILSGFKRPHTTLQQYEAIKNQTYKDIEIIFWANKTDNISFPETVVQNTHAIMSNTDYGSWGRFVAALNARTEYICVIDDDTIPGKKWIENCFTTMQNNEGILSTRGVIANCGFDHLYPLPQSYVAVGWCNPNENILRVDMGCHSWFFKKHWLRAFFAEMPTVFPMRYGEDTHISYAVKKHFDINTYIPPHPKNDMDLWGSMPETAIRYGEEPVAISMDNNANYGMNQYWNFVRQMGYKLICEEQE